MAQYDALSNLLEKRLLLWAQRLLGHAHLRQQHLVQIRECFKMDSDMLSNLFMRVYRKQWGVIPRVLPDGSCNDQLPRHDRTSPAGNTGM